MRPERRGGAGAAAPVAGARPPSPVAAHARGGVRLGNIRWVVSVNFGMGLRGCGTSAWQSFRPPCEIAKRTFHDG